MEQEERIAQLNEGVFLREFVYCNTRFRSQSGQEYELCDGAIWLDDTLILFQAKRRSRDDATRDVENESKWFTKKVSKEAVGQLADSVRYLQTESSLPLLNRHGQELNFSGISPATTHHVVLYKPSPFVDERLFLTKGRISGRIGFVHFISEANYRAVCDTMQTPMEISQYLQFRSDYVVRDPNSHKVSEKALVGKYLTDTDELPDVCDEHEFITDRLINDPEEFSISRLLHEYLEKLRSYKGNDESLQYHKILMVLAKMKRNVMREFKRRLLWAMDKAESGARCTPSRMYLQYLDCAFLFLPLDGRDKVEPLSLLEGYAKLCKQDLRSRLCLAIGVAKAPHPYAERNSFMINWLHLEGEWSPDEQLDSYLKNNPDCFRPVRGVELGLYNLR